MIRPSPGRNGSFVATAACFSRPRWRINARDGGVEFPVGFDIVLALSDAVLRAHLTELASTRPVAEGAKPFHARNLPRGRQAREVKCVSLSITGPLVG
jgi:hypothetical protein